MIWEQELAKDEKLNLQTLRNWRKKMDQGKHWTKGKEFAAKVFYTDLGAEIVREIKRKKVEKGDLKMPVERTEEEANKIYDLKFMRFPKNKRLIMGIVKGDETNKQVRIIVRPERVKFLKPRRSWIKAKKLDEDLYTMINVSQQL